MANFGQFLNYFTYSWRKILTHFLGIFIFGNLAKIYPVFQFSPKFSVPKLTVSSFFIATSHKGVSFYFIFWDTYPQAVQPWTRHLMLFLLNVYCIFTLAWSCSGQDMLHALSSHAATIGEQVFEDVPSIWLSIKWGHKCHFNKRQGATSSPSHWLSCWAAHTGAIKWPITALKLCFRLVTTTNPPLEPYFAVKTATRGVITSQCIDNDHILLHIS